MILVEILGRVVQANLIIGESVMDSTIPTHADSSVAFVVVVGVGVDGMTVTTIVSKIGIGIFLHDREIVVPKAHADPVGNSYDRIVRLRDLQQAEM